MSMRAEYQVAIVRTKRRTLAMALKPNGILEVRAPLRSPEQAIEDFLLQNERWIAARIKEWQQRQSEQPHHAYSDGEEFLFLGERYTLRITQNQRRTLMLEDQFLLHEASVYRAPLLFEQWYREELRKYLTDRIKYFSEHLPQPRRIRVTDASTRWGSCSPEGNVNFCWRLIMAPPAIIDYVIIHELAHLKHADHGQRFWNLVAEFDPSWKLHRRWLHTKGHTLTL